MSSPLKWSDVRRALSKIHWISTIYYLYARCVRQSVRYILFVPQGQTFLTHRRGGTIFLHQGGTNIFTSRGAKQIFFWAKWASPPQELESLEAQGPWNSSIHSFFSKLICIWLSILAPKKMWLPILCEAEKPWTRTILDIFWFTDDYQ